MQSRWRLEPGTLYDDLADRVAAGVMSRYSTSFTLATRLLGRPVRRDIRNLYAVVRVADEIVDGAATTAGESPQRVRELLDAYAQAVTSAPGRSFHTDPVLHAWAGTARRCRLDPADMEAFFTSMRSDLDPVVHDRRSLASYIHGSAEVIGLMCLDIFITHGSVTADRDWLREGASSMGSAFQKINFLRDIGADTSVLHRSYLPEPFTGDARDRLLDECSDELDVGCTRIPALPVGARAGVAAAAALYRELLDRLRATPVDDLTGPRAVRVSVPAPVKALVTAKAAGRAVLS
ncbi:MULTISPECIES: phytoene/squalene synthase family protein [Corynebacterium]|uniref:phytoene/squalene synthase family protein n=1 Tax=Corynebacterium TaxID=1716 RepID=UPI001F2A652B|nr:squalene/phytoene synthase family protein [Corynebacterium neomassiliense]MCI1255123.1 squalene/phytoene synthase family protein [Corynebacterium provencense]